MGWKRRFENRIDVEIVTPDQDSDAVSGIRQGSVKKVFNNKIHPGNNTESHAKSAVNVEEFKQRQAELQKIICILLCTTFPLLTTAATLIRLWQVGVIDFISKQECPSGWIQHRHVCFLALDHPLNWTQAMDNCEYFGGNIPSQPSENIRQYIDQYTEAEVGYVWLNVPQKTRERRRRIIEMLDTQRSQRDQRCSIFNNKGVVERIQCSDLAIALCVKHVKRRKFILQNLKISTSNDTKKSNSSLLK